MENIVIKAQWLGSSFISAARLTPRWWESRLYILLSLDFKRNKKEREIQFLWSYMFMKTW